MTLRYYITDLGEGKVTGTHSKDIAKEFAVSEDYIVIDALHGKWLLPDGSAKDIQREESKQ